MPKDVGRIRSEQPPKAPISKLPIKSSRKSSQLIVKELNGTEEDKDFLKRDDSSDEHLKDALIDEASVILF